MSGYNGNGVFSFTYNWVNDAANGVPITAPRMDQEFADATGAFNLCLTRDAQGMATALIPFPFGITALSIGPSTGSSVSFPSGQIAFPATQNPSSDPNTLDDYEEGAWTPSVGGTATYTTQTGTYTKIGRLVFFRCSLTINVLGSGATSAISGLPFAAAASITSCSIGFFTGIALSVVSLNAYINGSSIILSGLTAGATSITDNLAAMGNSTRIEISGAYQV